MTIEQDGTLDAAAAAIDTIPPSEMEKPGRETNRDDAGRFAKDDPPEKAIEKQPEVKADPKEAKPDDTADDDEPYVELAPEEEGKEPTRLKLSDVLEGFKKSSTLEAELARAREQGPPPEIWDNQIVETVKARQQLMSNIETWARLNQPQPPSIEMIDPNSPNYNPDRYFADHQRYQALSQAHNQAKQQWDAQAHQLAQEQAAVHQVMLQREKSKLEQFWPELREKATADRVRGDLKQHYGLDDATLDSVSDSRFFALAKDALAYRQQKAAAQTAAKIVTSKPKLIPGKARSSPTNGKAAAVAASMGQLEKSGHIDDAARVIAGLI